MKIILGGHWDSCPEGWECFGELEQDITNSLKWQDNSVDVIFTEHVLEHITLNDGICFMREAFRVLKEGGILRTAMPMLDKMITFKNDKLGQHYCEVQTSHYFKSEDSALKLLGLTGVNEEPISFMFDSLFKGHNHKFIYTSSLLKKILLKVGFSQIDILEPGYSNFDKNNCLERTIRGVNPEYLATKFGVTHYDPESLVVEAKK